MVWWDADGTQMIHFADDDNADEELIRCVHDA